MTEDRKAKSQVLYVFSAYRIDDDSPPIPWSYIEENEEFSFHENVPDNGRLKEKNGSIPEIKEVRYIREGAKIHSAQDSTWDLARKLMTLTWSEFVELGRPRTIVRTIEAKL